MEPSTPSAEATLEQVEWVRRLAVALVGDEAEADDVAQDVWLSALKSRPHFPGQAGVRRWLGAITRNAARQRGRREGRRRQLEPEAATTEALPSTDELIGRVGVQRRVVDLALGLPDPFRRAILLRYFEGLTPAAIAAREGAPVATVKTWLRRGLERLRERLDNEHGNRRNWILLLAPLTPKAGAAGAGVGVMLMGTKAILATTVAASAAVVGGFFWLSDDDPTEAAMTAAADPLVQPPVELAGVGEEGSGDELVEVGEVSMRQEVEPAPTKPASPVVSTIELIVVSKETGKPVPGTEVLYASQEALLEHIQGMDEPTVKADPAGVVLEIGESLVADSSGVARIPGNEEGIGFAAGRAPGLFGLTMFRYATEEPVELVLSRDRTLRFLTVDEKDNPLADVPVGVRIGGGGAEWIVTSGPGGHGELRHFDTILGEALEMGEEVALVLPFPLAEPVEFPIDDALFDDVVKLVVPETGSLRVDAFDEGGQPLEGQLIQFMANRKGAGIDAARATRSRAAGRTVEGTVLLPRVGLGLEFRVSMPPEQGLGRTLKETQIYGPSAPGEEVSVELRFQGGAPGFVGLAVGEDGRPIADRRGTLNLVMQRSSGRESFRRLELKTDAQGAFRVTTSGPNPLDVSCLATLRFAESGELAERSVSFPIAVPLAEAGNSDLGTLTVVVPPLIVAGQVLDEDGEPVHQAWVHLARRRGNATEWVHELGATSRADGSFELRGELGSGEVFLHASANDFRATGPMEFNLSDEGYEIVLEAACKLEGLLLVGEGVPADRLRVTVQSLEVERDRPSQPTTVHGSALSNGRFEVDRLYAGRSEVRVGLPDVDEPLVRLEVNLERGVNTIDPIELPDGLALIRVKIQDPEGGAVNRGHAVVVANQTTRHLAFAGGELALMTPFLPVDIEVFGDGYLPSRLDGVASDATVQLKRGLTVTLRLPDDFVVPSPPAQLQVTLVNPDEDARLEDATMLLADGESVLSSLLWWDGSFVQVGADRTVAIRVGPPGEYEVRWRLSDGARLDGLIRGARYVIRGRETTINIGRDSKFTVAPEEAPYAAAMERLLDGD